MLRLTSPIDVSVLIISSFVNMIFALVMEIAHVRYIKILIWVRVFRVKISNFSRVAIPRRDISAKKQTKYRKMTLKPRSHVRILIYRTWAIEAVGISELS